MIALPDGGALVVGGWRSRRPKEQADEAAQPTTTVERFNPETRTWAPTDGFDASGRRPAMAVLADGRVLAVAGANTAIYDPAARTWTGSVPIPDHRNDATAVLLEDGSVLVAGGWQEWVPDTPGCPDAHSGHVALRPRDRTALGPPRIRTNRAPGSGFGA